MSYGKRTSLLLALCKVRQKEYASASEILTRTLGPANLKEARGLYESFTHQDMGMISDAIEKLKAVIESLPWLPTPCLLLGDLFLALGQGVKAGPFWQKAVRRDIPGGAVGLTAQRQLARLTRRAVRNAAQNTKRAHAVECEDS